MISFQVNDMTGGHCVSTITKAVRSADPGAGVEISPVAVADAPPRAVKDAPRGGCCCR